MEDTYEYISRNFVFSLALEQQADATDGQTERTECSALVHLTSGGPQ